MHEGQPMTMLCLDSCVSTCRLLDPTGISCICNYKIECLLLVFSFLLNQLNIAKSGGDCLLCTISVAQLTGLKKKKREVPLLLTFAVLVF